MDYLRWLQERQRPSQAQAGSGVRQKRTYDTHCRGQDFAPGDRVVGPQGSGCARPSYVDHLVTRRLSASSTPRPSSRSGPWSPRSR
ncbi:hypothetical protein AAFF_G00382260 [Aldrovandia affinis]|uniref:Uncharacterized protein n=1 Tax=Aldrovandia affinis TaxID=143900 RepID=A0AAD7X1Q0_9TELE|nr:hypothetical protein AAFF_G00382260 [Aldrovandia affinis]